MISCKQFRKYVIQRAISYIGVKESWWPELLVSTAAHESKGGFYIAQTDGPAMGPYQEEPTTYHDIYQEMSRLDKQYTDNTEQLKVQQLKACYERLNTDSIVLSYNLLSATIAAIAFYLIRMTHDTEDEIPKSNDIAELWKPYKKHWNTNEGKATFEEFKADYEKYIVT